MPFLRVGVEGIFRIEESEEGSVIIIPEGTGKLEITFLKVAVRERGDCLLQPVLDWRCKGNAGPFEAAKRRCANETINVECPGRGSKGYWAFWIGLVGGDGEDGSRKANDSGCFDRFGERGKNWAVGARNEKVG
jgi:hypothetical protein